MKFLKIVTISIAALGVTIFITLWRAGAFADVHVEKGEQGGYLLIGADHKGSYQKIGSVFNEVKKIQEAFKMDSSMFVGVYFDDPGSVPEDQLKSFAAFVIPDSTAGNAIIKKHPHFHYLNIPKSRSYFTELKTNGMISMIIAAVKAYPKLGDAVRADRVSPDAKGMAFEEYHNGFTRFVMHIQ
jgi:hypothetical protein